jgi:hypothetical protein
MTIDDSGYAFPKPRDPYPNDGVGYDGMSLRDYFAAHCPQMPEQWYLDSLRKKANPQWHWGEASAAWAYFYADAMIAARKEGRQL